MSETQDDLFNPASPTLENETKPLSRVIKIAIESALLNLHTWLPAQVTQVNGDGTVSIQPLLKRAYASGVVKALPVIQNVMVNVPRGTDYWIKLPVAVGDTGVALFCERSLDKWGVAGGQIDPGDSRTHDLSDPVFIPGVYPKNAPLAGDATDLVVHNGSAEATLKKAGKFQFKGSSEELLSILDDLTDTLINALVLTGIGPEPFTPDTVTQLTEIKTRLETLKV